ncbi:unnamed protein product [Merluccius merluccius]
MSLVLGPSGGRSAPEEPGKASQAAGLDTPLLLHLSTYTQRVQINVSNSSNTTLEKHSVTESLPMCIEAKPKNNKETVLIQCIKGQPLQSRADRWGFVRRGHGDRSVRRSFPPSGPPVALRLIAAEEDSEFKAVIWFR